MFTGAIGDYGTSLKLNKDHTRFSLKKGTFEINGTVLQTKLAKTNPTVDLTTCTASETLTAPVTMMDGTGAYKGISGTINATVTFATISPFYASGKNKGRCDLSNSAPILAQYGSIQGSGTVKFT